MSPEVKANTSQQVQYESVKERSEYTGKWMHGYENVPNYTLVDPAHYKSLKPEPIDVIHAWKLSFCVGSALKYIARAGHKPGANVATDLAKAIQYLQLELKRLKNDGK